MSSAAMAATDPDRYITRWNLEPDGKSFSTRSSALFPVRQAGLPAILKIAKESEEWRGGRLMIWWQGEGAARVLAEDDGVLLLERATGPRSLVEMVHSGQDDEATRLLCAAANRLHGHRAPLPAELVPLIDWFAPLLKVDGPTGLVAQAQAIARELLADQQEIVALHGDIHHGNILDAGMRGWIAIDPKGLLGDRAFDFVNILRNPDDATALVPARFARQVEVITEAAGLDRQRLLRWTLAFASLSAVWILEEGDTPGSDLAVAAMARAALEA